MSIESLKTSRASTKGSITRIKNIIEAKQLSVTELECRLGIVESYFKQALSYQTQIEGLDPSDTGRSELEEIYVSTKSKILSQMGSEREGNALENSISIPHSINHLPYAKLPRFSGKYSEYKNFINTFKKRVHNDSTLSKIEKFNHLLNCLTDQALGTVKTFQITDENYEKAIARLKERYDNDCLIFLEYISQLFELPKVQKVSASNLRALVDNVSALFNSLQSIGTESEILNAIIIHIAMSKADSESQAKWDEQLKYDKLPKWEECSEVLSRRCQYLEARESKIIHFDTSKKQFNKQKSIQTEHPHKTSLTITQQCCSFCHDNTHNIISCSNFTKLSFQDRFMNIKKLGLCINCLRKGHNVAKCSSIYKCKYCKRSHHSLLHRPTESQGSATALEPPNSGTSSTASVAVNFAMESDLTQVILATAIVLVRDASGSFQLGRVLLDSGSQVNMIQENFAKTLSLPVKRKNVDIQGIGMTETKSGFVTQTTIRSRYSPYEIALEFLVLSSITGYQPDPSLVINNWNLPKNLELADEQFNRSAPVDMLLGAEIFFDLLLVGQIKLGCDLPSLQNSQLGWIISGKCTSSKVNQNRTCCISSYDNRLDALVQRFWELESVSGIKSKWSEEQIECEKHFKESMEIVPSGRIMLKLPFKEDPSVLGESYKIAFRRFLSLEHRLAKDQELKSSYVDFLKEYEALGHMSRVENPDLSQPHYYLPHQCVLRPNSTSTKLRVVFDASCHTSSNISLNRILMVGPTIQDDLFLVLLRFRLNRFAMTADIVKMYRQVLVHPDHRRFQYILWRETEKTPIETYALNTITYGTSSAPFMAIRCLQYLGDKYDALYKLGAQALRNDFYVDDLITGADDIDTLKQKQSEVVSILKSAGFELSKWNCNHSLFSSEFCGKNLHINESNVTSTLGITWNPHDDQFYFSYNPSQMYTSFTKRKILSIASSLFDPLGLLCPIIVKAKIILQKLWMDKVDWDAAIPQSTATEWQQFMTDLHSIQNLPVPRYALAPSKHCVQIHGFCDASINAYGCCIYLRTIDIDGFVSVKLLVAKSKVSPSKQKQIPRLELCAAHLLAKLWSKINPVFKDSYSEAHFWTDSSVVLHWISTHTSKLNTFVGNRIAEIQETTVGINWRHVPTECNPADISSRGCTVEELVTSIWSTGPSFLLEPSEKWPSNPKTLLSMEQLSLEKKKTALFCGLTITNDLLNTINNCSSYTKILHIFAYILRFAHIRQRRPFDKICSTEELVAAFNVITWIEQSVFFAEEINSIKGEKEIKSSLKHLSPFLDASKDYPILRVGGRLQNSNLTEEQKHPALLAKESNFAICFVRHLHVKNYHAGPKALVALLRQKVWIINARHLARKIVNKCIHCVRYKPKLLQQVMGNLPSERIIASRPFLRCGVDFCGPIYTYHRIRGKVPYKTYVSVFVCFTSKAVHLEPVSDLSAEAFIAALKRMISRRGLPQNIFCDNATNFVGANSKLTELHNMLFRKTSQDFILDFCSNEHIKFNFIPPRAPHFGGIWEAAVKSAKGHLFRTLHNSKLSFEELATALCEIEAVMNSRPITPLTNDPNDYEALTPGHLLIGSPLKAIPEPADEAPITGVLKYWRRIHNVKTHFWKRWTEEYLQELQQRTKWSSQHPNLVVDSMVVVHEDNAPPQRWLLGRVQATFPGRDGKIRVAEIRTSKGIIKRPIHKLAILPC